MITNSSKARFDTRLPLEQKLLFEKAAAYAGFNSLSEFILSTVQKEALEIIKEHESIILSQRDSKIFFEALLNPKEPNEALKKAAEEYKEWLND